jgi:hypothetical protein
MKQESAQAMMEAVEAKVVQFRADLAAGKSIDLKGFEERIHALCTLVTSLPPEESVSYEPRLREVSKALEEVSRGLARQYESVKRELVQIETKQKAQDAYHRASKTKPPEDTK